MVALRRSSSCFARPRLLTSSMLRSDSVVAPARAVVSLTITFWMVFTRLLSEELMNASTGTVSRNAGPMDQWTENEYTITNTTPTSVVNTKFTNWLMNRSVSDRTFWSLPRVSPLRWSSKVWKGSAREWRMPSEYRSAPTRCTITLTK